MQIERQRKAKEKACKEKAEKLKAEILKAESRNCGSDPTSPRLPPRQGVESRKARKKKQKSESVNSCPSFLGCSKPAPIPKRYRGCAGPPPSKVRLGVVAAGSGACTPKPTDAAARSGAWPGRSVHSTTGMDLVAPRPKHSAAGMYSVAAGSLYAEAGMEMTILCQTHHGVGRGLLGPLPDTSRGRKGVAQSPLGADKSPAQIHRRKGHCFNRKCLLARRYD